MPRRPILGLRVAACSRLPWRRRVLVELASIPETGDRRSYSFPYPPPPKLSRTRHKHPLLPRFARALFMDLLSATDHLRLRLRFPTSDRSGDPRLRRSELAPFPTSRSVRICRASPPLPHRTLALSAPRKSGAHAEELRNRPRQTAPASCWHALPSVDAATALSEQQAFLGLPRRVRQGVVSGSYRCWRAWPRAAPGRGCARWGSHSGDRAGARCTGKKSRLDGAPCRPPGRGAGSLLKARFDPRGALRTARGANRGSLDRNPLRPRFLRRVMK